LQSFWFLERTSDFQTASVAVCEQVKSVLLPEMGQMNPKVWAVSVHSPVKDVVSS